MKRNPYNMPDKIPVLHIITAAPQNERGIMELIDKTDIGIHYFLFDNTEFVYTVWPEWNKYKNRALTLPSKSKLARYRYIREAIRRSGKVVLHGMYFSRMIYYFMFHWNLNFLEKFTWIEWGADLYEWERPETTFLNKKLNSYGQEIRSRIPQIVMTFPVDEITVRKKCSKTVETVLLPLPSIKPMLPRIDEAFTEKKTDKLRIQIAHNALLTNNQIRILSNISKFSSENVQVIVPVAYNIGDVSNTIDKKAYKNAVIKMADYYFGKKAVPFRNMIALDNYMKYLWTVDIIIFDIYRPCGISNLLFMIYMGKKIFLPSDSDYYRYLTKHGIKVYDTDSIPDMTFEEFSSPAEKSDLSMIYDFFDYDKNIEKWNQMLTSWEHFSEHANNNSRT